MHRCKVFFPIPIPLFMNALSITYWINSFLSGETLFHQYFIRKMLLRKIIRLIWIVLTFLSHKTNFTPTKKPPKHAINKCRMTLTFKHFTQNTPIQFKMAISDFNLNEYRYIVNIICVYKNSRTIGPTSWEWMIEELSVYCNIVAELILHSHLLLSKLSELNYLHHERIMNLQ